MLSLLFFAPLAFILSLVFGKLGFSTVTSLFFGVVISAWILQILPF